MICRYCEEDLEDEHYTYMPFKDADGQSLMKPVHSYHLDATRGMDKGTSYKAERTTDDKPTAKDRDIRTAQ